MSYVYTPECYNREGAIQRIENEFNQDMSDALNFFTRVARRTSLRFENIGQIIEYDFDMARGRRYLLSDEHQYSLDMFIHFWETAGRSTFSALSCGYYNYALIDPRDHVPFYVGVGSHGRCTRHDFYAWHGKHENKQMQEKCQEIFASNNEIEYAIVDYCQNNKHRALEVENDLIELLGIENLCNRNHGVSDFTGDGAVEQKLAWILMNSHTWFQLLLQKWSLSVRDRTVLVTIIAVCYHYCLNESVSVSVRDVAELSGITKNTASKGISILRREGILRRTFKGVTSYSSRYRLHPELLESAGIPSQEEQEWLCTKNRNFLELISHDAFRYSALNNTGLMIYLYMFVSGHQFATRKQLSEALRLSSGQIRTAVNRMLECGILKSEGRTLHASENPDLDAASQMFKTEHKGSLYESLHQYERYEYMRRRMLKRIIYIESGEIHSYNFILDEIVPHIERYLPDSFIREYGGFCFDAILYDAAEPFNDGLEPLNCQ